MDGSIWYEIWVVGYDVISIDWYYFIFVYRFNLLIK